MKRKKRGLQRKLTPELKHWKPKSYVRWKNKWNNLRHKFNHKLTERKLKWNERINNTLSDPKNTELFWRVVNNPIRKPPQTIPPLKDKEGAVGEEVAVEEEELKVETDQDLIILIKMTIFKER